MIPQRLLLLTADRLSAHRWRAGRIYFEAGFSGDTEGLQNFARYLEQNRLCTFRLLALQAEDSFQFESIPSVRGRDRAALLARKLTQHFHAAPLALALSLGREQGRRRYERFLFAALTGNQLLEPWLEQLLAARIRFAGLYTLPLLASGIGADAASTLPLYQLLTPSCCGLHQTVFEYGQPRLSRLTQLESEQPQAAALAAAAESARIYQYLVAQRAIEPGTALTTLILVHPRQLAEFRDCCRDSDELRFAFIDLLAEAKKSGLKTLPEESHSETLFLHLAIRKPPRAQFAPASLRRGYQLWRTQLALTGASVAILVASVLFGAAQMIVYLRLSDEAAQLRLLTANDRSQYQLSLQGLPPMPVDLGLLIATLARYDQLDRQATTLMPMYRRISQALDAVPGIEIERIDWAADASGNGAPGSASTELLARLPAELSNKPRAQLDAINRFSAALRHDQAVVVQNLVLPFEPGSNRSLKGGSDQDSKPGLNHDAPRFSLRIADRR